MQERRGVLPVRRRRSSGETLQHGSQVQDVLEGALDGSPFDSTKASEYGGKFDDADADSMTGGAATRFGTQVLL